MEAYVRAFSSGEWFGGWAPVEAELLWKSDKKALLRLVEEGLEEDDEYEFYRRGSLLLCLWDDGAWKAVYGLSPDTCLEDIHPPMNITNNNHLLLSEDEVRRANHHH